MYLIVALVADILKITEAECECRIIDVAWIQMDSMVDDHTRTLMAFLAETSVQLDSCVDKCLAASNP